MIGISYCDSVIPNDIEAGSIYGHHKNSLKLQEYYRAPELRQDHPFTQVNATLCPPSPTREYSNLFQGAEAPRLSHDGRYFIFLSVSDHSFLFVAPLTSLLSQDPPRCMYYSEKQKNDYQLTYRSTVSAHLARFMYS